MTIKTFLALAVVLAALSPGRTPTQQTAEPIPACPDATPQSTHGFVRYGQPLEQAPDFIAVSSSVSTKIGGYVNRDRFLPNRSNDPLPVCDESLTTTVGHWYPGRGFIPLGIDPETVPNTARCYDPSGPTLC